MYASLNTNGHAATESPTNLDYRVIDRTGPAEPRCWTDPAVRFASAKDRVADLARQASEQRKLLAAVQAIEILLVAGVVLPSDTVADLYGKLGLEV